MDKNVSGGPLHCVVGRNPVYVPVYTITPFWRYAVGPEEAFMPAIPFFFKGNAEKMFYKLVNEFPDMCHALYRRTWKNRIETILIHRPEPNPQDHRAVTGSDASGCSGAVNQNQGDKS